MLSVVVVIVGHEVHEKLTTVQHRSFGKIGIGKKKIKFILFRWRGQDQHTPKFQSNFLRSSQHFYDLMQTFPNCWSNFFRRKNQKGISFARNCFFFLPTLGGIYVNSWDKYLLVTQRLGLKLIKNNLCKNIYIGKLNCIKSSWYY